MKKLTQEEKIRLVPVGGQKGTSPVRQNAFSLNVGEVLFIPKKEWNSYRYSKKTTIGSLLYNEKKKFSSKQHILDKERGYAVTRIK